MDSSEEQIATKIRAKVIIMRESMALATKINEMEDGIRNAERDRGKLYEAMNELDHEIERLYVKILDAK